MANENKYQPFRKQADEISKKFYIPAVRAWVKKNKLADVANELTRRLEDAQTEDEFNEAYQEYHDRLVVPFYNAFVANKSNKAKNQFFSSLPKSDYSDFSDRFGNFDQLSKNGAFSKSRFRRKGSYPFGDGKDESFVPLMTLINDPYELDRAAFELKVSPDKLKAYIRQKFAERQKEYAQQVREQLNDKMDAERARMASDRKPFGDSKWLNTASNLVGDIFFPETIQSVQKAIREGKDPGDFWKSFGKDFGIGAASMFLPGKIAGLATNAAARAGWGTASRISLDALIQGLVDGLGIEGARQFLSNYDKFDPQNMWNVGSTSTTIPASASGLLALLSSIPGLGRKIAKVGRRLKGNMLDYKDVENDNALSLFEEARDWAKQPQKPYEEYVSRGTLEDVRKFTEASLKKPDVPFTDAELKSRLANDPTFGFYFFPPKEPELDMLGKMIKSGNESEIKKAEEILDNMKAVWPENMHVNHRKVPLTRREKIVSTAFNNFVNAAARTEVAKQRGSSSSKGLVPSESLQEMIENDDPMLRAWDEGMFLRDGSGRMIPEAVEYKRLKEAGAI